MVIKCGHCGKDFEKTNGEINQAKKRGFGLFCNKACWGMSKRKNKTAEQNKADKAEYDRQFRKENRERLKKEKHEYFKRTYDKEQAALVRKANMPRHVEYCRQPKYKEYKKKYDEKHRAKKEYGEFADAALILFEIEKELDRKSPEMLSRKFENGTLNKSQKRKRQWQRIHHQN